MNLASPFIADIALGLMYLMLALAVGVTIASMVRMLRLRTKEDDTINGVPQARIVWTVSAAVVLLLVVTFLVGSAEPLLTNGKPFRSVFWLKAVDMFIYSSVILILGCFVSVIVNRFRN